MAHTLWGRPVRAGDAMGVEASLINVFMLAEELGGTVLPGRKTAPETLNLARARRFSPTQAAWRDDCAYVVREDELATARSRVPRATFVQAGGPLPAGWSGQGALLVLSDATGPQEALDRVLAVFERYTLLEADMLRDAVAGRSIAAVLGRCANLLANPIAVADSTFTVVARTDTHGKSDGIWDAVEASDHAEESVLSPEQIRAAERSHGPHIFTVGNVTVLQTCIRMDGRPAGYVGATALFAPFTSGQIAITWWLNEELESMWPLLTRNAARTDTVEQAALLVIEGEPVNRAMLLRALAQRSWSEGDAYRLLCFHRNGEPVDETRLGPATNQLRHHFPKGATLEHEGEILVVLHGDEAAAALDEDALCKTMQANDLRCAASHRLDGFQNLRRAYEQCTIVRGVAADARAAAGEVMTFTEALIPCLAKLIGASLDPATIVHPQVAAIAQRAHGTEFLHSLRLYLANGRNLTRTARALYVHRSSLTYRIEQIEKVLGFSLDEADEATLVQLYLSCVLLEEKPSA